MRILELEIHNVRGIRDLVLTPAGHNIAVWGPNGSGKSAVVDAIDFLLTGRVTRLTGKGTAGLTLAKHGPHVDQKPESATVRASIQISGVPSPVEISRSMANPNVLVVDKSVKPKFEPVMLLARQGQHVLTRREILKYITAEASTRAAEIQELLNLSEVEQARKSLVRAQNDLEKELQIADRALQTAQSAVNATIQQGTFLTEKVLEAINSSRSVLGGSALPSYDSADIKVGLESPVASSAKPALNINLVQKDIASVYTAMEPASTKLVGSAIEQLIASIAAVNADPGLMHALHSLELNKLGLTLLGDNDNCPLCGIAWPKGKLKESLDKKIKDAAVAEAHNKKITTNANIVIDSSTRLRSHLQSIFTAAQSLSLSAEAITIDAWIRDLDTFTSELSDPLETYRHPTFRQEQVTSLISPADWSGLMTRVGTYATQQLPSTTPEQIAWDTLTRLEENLRGLNSATASQHAASAAHRRAVLLHSSFLSARDHVLTTLYDSIRDRFVELYKHIHGPDEQAFSASLEPQGAGLDFQVDFYGRGAHPPHAFHSEGHQDSMGICLYLALADRLTRGVIDLIILDDVVMSVDADHRRLLCSLLSQFFSHRQFVITTHDRTWATQLRTEGVVQSSRVYEFYNWSIDTGPQVNFETGLWNRIESDLKKHDVPTAAAHLRRASEQYFAQVSDALRASVIYKITGRWELGDYLPAAMKQLRQLVAHAKDVARKWHNTADSEMLSELETTIASVFARSQAEQWAINANVHYSRWPDFSEQDFLPVVQAFQDLFGLYTCTACSGVLHVSMKGLQNESVRCNCGKVNWNLVSPS